MAYTFSKTLDGGFDETIVRVTAALKDAGFGVLTEIDVKATLKNKLDVDFRNYRILGACNPGYAYRAPAGGGRDRQHAALQCGGAGNPGWPYQSLGGGPDRIHAGNRQSGPG